jgi:ADP-ribosylglycohydrolase
MFYKWLYQENHEPYNSFGNGSAMRASSVAWIFNTASKVLKEAKKSAEITHNHPEGIKGSQATALAIYMAKKGFSKEKIRKKIERKFNYNLNRKLDDIRTTYNFNVTCQGSVPEAIICFLESKDYEDTIRNVISLGGDADTQGAIAGAIAEAYYKHIPEKILNHCLDKLNLQLLNLISEFTEKYNKQIDKIVKNKITEINLIEEELESID